MTTKTKESKKEKTRKISANSVGSDKKESTKLKKAAEQAVRETKYLYPADCTSKDAKKKFRAECRREQKRYEKEIKALSKSTEKDAKEKSEKLEKDFTSWKKKHLKEVV